MPSTWSSDMNKINIDLDNLTFGKIQQKPQTLSLKEMQKQASSTSPTTPQGCFLTN